ncbi:MAG: hypothetical protein LAO51_04040 [Acidobacteriia bacterium]|nr:hypothetical protein [Terriglobia bacterium]
MNRRDLGRILAAAGLTLAVTATFTALAQEAPAPPQNPTDTAAAGEAKRAEAEGNQTVETILRQQEQILSGQRFSYDPAGRRDPFRSLYEDLAIKRKGPRPRGVAGMLVSEIVLVGLVRDPSGGDMTLFMGSDNKGYFLRVGDEVYDGTLIAVDPKAGTVTFRQQVDDPRLIKPYRDVVKRLVPLEEEKANE